LFEVWKTNQKSSQNNNNETKFNDCTEIIQKFIKTIIASAFGILKEANTSEKLEGKN